MFLWRNKKTINIFQLKSMSYLELCSYLELELCVINILLPFLALDAIVLLFN